jgi:hypothetical protein
MEKAISRFIFYTPFFLSYERLYKIPYWIDYRNQENNKIATAAPALKNGAYGIVSIFTFLAVQYIILKNTPNREPKNIVHNVNFTPKNVPSAKINFTSPPPKASLLKILLPKKDIMKNNTPPHILPNKPLIARWIALFTPKIVLKGENNIPTMKSKIFISSYITLCIKSIPDIITKNTDNTEKIKKFTPNLKRSQKSRSTAPESNSTTKYL